jgi:hypothetical protein
MLPRTFLGWAVLIVVVLVIFSGWAGAGHDIHSWITGIGTFAHAASGH